MSLSSAMSAGVSGLSINAEAISVVGNNIANVNTTGFKEGRTIFSDMLSANIGVGQVGRGGQIQTVQNLFSQGSFENTSGTNDLALQGDSFFVLQDSAGTQSFTRAGAFDYNKSQVLVNPDGLEVVGYGITQATGLSNGVTGKIDKTAFATLPSKTTTAANFVLNLDSTSKTPGSSETSSIKFNGDFGQAGMTTGVDLTAAGNAVGGGVSIVAANGTSYTGNLTVPGGGPLLAGQAGAPLAITVNGQTTTIGTYSTDGAGLITAVTYNNPVSVAVAAGVTQPITFTTGAGLVGSDIALANTAGTTSTNAMPANTTLNFFDEFGNSQSATVAWGGTIPTYTYSISVPNAVAGTPGSAGFEITGSLNFPTPTTTSVTSIITLNNGAQPLPVTFDLSNMKNTAAVVTPTVTVNGSAGQATGTVMAVGGSTTTPATPVPIAVAVVAPAGATSIQLVSVAGLQTGMSFDSLTAGGGNIPNNTIITGIDATTNTITISNALTPAGLGLADTVRGTGSVFSMVDTTGTVHYGNIQIGAGSWTARIAGAAAPITGAINSTAAGSTWDQATKNVTINGVTQPVNFDFSQTTTATTGPAINSTGFNIASASTTSNFSNSTQVYDSQGNAHTANVYYRKTGANTWNFHLSVPDATSINGMAGNNVLNGTMTFNADGVLVGQTPSNTNGITVQFPGGVASQTITLDFNPNLSTQQASQSIVSSQTQDGYGAGTLISTSIDDKGYVNATYSNNQTQRIAQITTAKFAAVGGLEKAGGSLFNATSKSGTALLGTVDSQGGKIFTKSLEQSNVDMATQLVNMIRLQRAYTGNSKTITTSDQMMQETLTLIR